MKRFTNKTRIVVLLSAGFLLTACATYYKVTDPSSGNIYYTEKVKREGSAAQFKDARSGAEVTIQNSEVLEISGKQFDAGLKTPVTKAAPASPAAPIPAAAPSAAPTPAPVPAPSQSTAPEEGSK